VADSSYIGPKDVERIFSRHSIYQKPGSIMRVLIVNSEHPPIGGGAGNASANLARQLTDLGDEVTILTCRYRDFPKYSVENGVQIFRVISRRKEISRSNPLEQFTFLLGSILEGVPFIHKWKPTAIISFFGMPSGPLGWLGKKLMRIPYIISLRGGDVPGFRTYDFGTLHKIAGPVLRMLWKESDALVGNSKGLRTLANKFAPDIHCHIIHNGVDTEFFKFKENRGENQHIVFTGRLVHQKGVDIVIKSLSELKHLDWRFTIIGDGPARDDLNGLVETHGLVERIHFLGWKTRAEIRDVYSNASIFVFPSRDEGMSNAVLEAMSAGLAVIASDIEGNQDVIQDQITGFLAPVDAVDAWKEKLEELLNTPELARQIGLAANQHVDEHFSWSKVAQAYRDLIEKAI
jgi:glycosyltransferase involved in cell wall biosynthesis